jgi:hypothetical protein
MIHQDAIYNGTLSSRTVANKLRTQFPYRSTLKKPHEIGKGAFGPTFNDKPACGHGCEHEHEHGHRHENNDSPSSSSKTQKSRQNTKRKYTGGSRSGCPACGLKHQLDQCLYCFPDLARTAAWFRPSERIQEACAKTLRDNKELAEQVAKLKKKQKQDGKKKNDKPATDSLSPTSQE